MDRFARLLFAVVAAATAALAPSAAPAHEIRPAVATVSLSPPEATLELVLNLEAVLAGIGPQHADTAAAPNAAAYDALRALPPDALRARLDAFLPTLREGLRVELDGTRAGLALRAADIPEAGDLRLARISTLRFGFALPSAARELRWSYAEPFGQNVLRVFEPGRAVPATAWLKDGAPSEPYLIGTGFAAPGGWRTIWRYAVLGFTHIVPGGPDHILFVLGLYLLSSRWKPLLAQVTAFTLAHSITLGLSMAGIVALPTAVVEPLIALSIAYVAIENVLTGRLHPWRPLVVFGFGLLHGLGFAGVLQEIGVPRAEFVPALVSFNLGVEAGQLAVIACAFALAGLPFRGRRWYRSRIVVPASLAIAAAGLWWTVERVAEFWLET